MFVKIKLQSNLSLGTIVRFDNINNFWSKDIISGVFGVISSSPEQNSETLEWWAEVTFSGTVYAIADRAIPDEGGKIEIIDGKVYVDNNTQNNGIISPLPRGQNSRMAGDLVMINI